MGDGTNRFVVGNEAFIPGQPYRDKSAPNDPGDQFMRWINRPGSGMANSPGVRPLSYVVREPFTDLPAFLVLVTKKAVQGGGYNPWKDEIDTEKRTVKYWGDAKLHPEKRLTDFQGNKVLQQVWDAIMAGEREHLPPILHFVKQKSGWVTFTGICGMTALETTFFEEKGQRVENLRCHLRILGEKEPIPLAWVHTRREAETPQEALRGAPAVWKAWIQSREFPSAVALNAESMAIPLAADAVRATGQGYSSDPRIRRAVELHAMKRAKEHFEKEGFTSMEDVSRKESFDFHGRDGTREIYIEVKGTETAGSRILLTSNEVEFARLHKDKMALFVLHSIEIREVNGEIVAEGGVPRVYWPWDVDGGWLTAVTYSYAFR